MAKIRVADEIKRLVYADPNRDPKEIFAELTERGVKTTEVSVASYRSDFLGSIALLRELSAFATPPPAAAPKQKKVRKLSRAARWSAACAAAGEALSELRAVQEEYEEWRDNLPEGLQGSPVGVKLEAVCDLDIEGIIIVVAGAEEVDLPLGFGRD